MSLSTRLGAGEVVLQQQGQRFNHSYGQVLAKCPSTKKHEKLFIRDVAYQECV